MTFCPLLHLTMASFLVSLVAPLPATAMPVQKGKAKATVSAPTSVRADDAVIPLPLNPIVPQAQRLCASRTPSGLGYTMLRASSGTKPGGGDLVLVNYLGYLAATGTVFDQGQRSALRVDGVIPGFSEGLQLTGKGGIVRLCIPAALGYGARATGPIPANADLVFQVELVDHRSAAEAAAPSPDPAPQKDAAPGS